MRAFDLDLMRRVRILEEAAEEAIEAAAWYELHRRGLGAELETAVETLWTYYEDDIIPLISVSSSRNTRSKRIMLRRFPYDMIVAQENDEIMVIAFAHHSRRPGYWRHRKRT